jgi:hypothetical protein
MMESSGTQEAIMISSIPNYRCIPPVDLSAYLPWKPDSIEEGEGPLLDRVMVFSLSAA